MKKTMVLCVMTLALAAPAGAQSSMGMSGGMTGMGAMQYYVGTWSCAGGTIGQPAQKASVSFTLQSGLLREWVVLPASGKMSTYLVSIAGSYDAKAKRYYETFMDNRGDWSASWAKPWSGNTEEWTDAATSDGKPGHGRTVRNSKNSYTYTGFPTPTGMKPNFRIMCTRVS